MIDEYYTFLIFGYHSDDLKQYSNKPVVAVCEDCYKYRVIKMNKYRELCQKCATKLFRKPRPIPKLCACGCGEFASPGHIFKSGHNKRGIVLSHEDKLKLSKAHTRARDPLPDGWNPKLGDITDNKECSTYLGDIAEIILSNIYDNVKVMPRGNHGYDVICNRDFKIDIKASASGDKGYWYFNIKKNKVADYFLCIAFESRDDLFNPVHLWMIPGHVVNHVTGTRISKFNVAAWSKYELSLYKLVSCCDTIR